VADAAGVRADAGDLRHDAVFLGIEEGNIRIVRIGNEDDSMSLNTQ
jgi:hypothetical protein